MKDVRELIRELGRRGTTVFLSSHLLHEVEQVCNRAVIINKGRTVIEGPVSALRPQGNAVKVLTSDQARAEQVLAGLLGADKVARDEEYLVVTADDGAVPELVRRLVAAAARRARRRPGPRAGPRGLLPRAHAELRRRQRPAPPRPRAAGTATGTRTRDRR